MQTSKQQTLTEQANRQTSEQANKQSNKLTNNTYIQMKQMRPKITSNTRWKARTDTQTKQNIKNTIKQPSKQ